MLMLVYENLNSFVRNQDPIKSLDLGYESRIHTFFRNLNISDKRYKIKENGKIIFHISLRLNGANITELPNNLMIKGNLYLYNVPIKKLPENLKANHIALNYSLITELPDNLIVNSISVSKNQTELINWIKHSKFKDKLLIW
jgi:hypothetical protein